MSSAPIELVSNMGPDWTRRPVVFVAGTYDKRIDTGEDFDTRTLGELFQAEPDDKPKLEGPAFIPSSYANYDAREHKVQKVRGEYVALTCDIDTGDLPLNRVESLVRAFCGDAAWLIYSSPHARPGDRRWRAVVPLAEPAPFDVWNDAQSAFFGFMEMAGVTVDRALARAGQLVFLPNVPPTHVKSGVKLRGGDNRPLHYQRATTGTNAPGLDLRDGAAAAGITDIRRKRAEDDAERERLRREAEMRRANAAPSTSGAIIADFDRDTPIATLLEQYGYRQCPRHSEDWRSPYQTGETFATRIMGDKWVSLSQSDAAARIGAAHASGCFGDAYDLFVHFEHQGDHKAAFRQLHRERKAAAPQQWTPEPVEYDPETGDPIIEMLEYDEAGEVVEAGPASDVSGLKVVDAFDFEECDIPTRPWVIPGVILSGYTHMLAAPGGSGKSLFTLQMAIALALGEPWGTFIPRRRAKTMVINVEDDLFEQRRRLSAARRVMDADKAALLGWVHLVEDTDNIIVAGFDEAHRRMVAKPIVPVLVDYIRRNKIDVLIVDPFTETFEGDENDNSEVKWAMRIWRDEIARATGCAVYLVHHTTKYAANGAGDANVVRGAGAIVNSTRISATLMPMTTDEAGAMGIEETERNLYVRYDDAKANQSLKSGKARWFQKQSIVLDNGDETHPADEVGALLPWSPPGMLDGISLHSIHNALDHIDGGLLDSHGAPTGTRYTTSTRGGTKSSGRWVGVVLINMLGMKEAQAGALIKTWLKNGVIIESEYHDPNRREDIKGVFAPLNCRPGEVF